MYLIKGNLCAYEPSLFDKAQLLAYKQATTVVPLEMQLL